MSVFKDSALKLFISSIFLFGFFSLPELSQAQIYYSTEDTVWMTPADGLEAQVIAEGAASGITVDTTSGFVYWTADEAFGANVYRTHPDSSGIETVVEGDGSFKGLAIDTENGKIYWADLLNYGAVMRSDLDGSNRETLVAGTEEDSITNGVLDVALDLENGKLYWVRTGGIMRANLDGTEVEKFVSITSYVQPPSITVNSRDGFVYWIETDDAAIIRADTETGAAETLLEAEDPEALALDVDGSKIYWANDFLFSGGGGELVRANLDGSEIQSLKETGTFTGRACLYVSGWNGTLTSRDENTSDLPGHVRLFKNYPNPFNPQTTLSYRLGEAANVTLEVYNFLGQKVSTLVDEKTQSAGIHNIIFDASGLPSGTYFYRLETPEKTFTNKMTLIK